MPKSGSTLLATYQECMLTASGRRSGQHILKRRFGGRYLAEASPLVMIQLIGIDALHGTIVVKNHWAHERWLNAMISLGLVKMTFAYRDPRDVIISAIDHGRRTRESGVLVGGFAEYESVLEAIPLVQRLVEQVERWAGCPQVLLVSYEELISRPDDTLRIVADFVGWGVSREQIRKIVDTQYSVRSKSLNFNTGRLERWKTEMNASERNAVNSAFRPFLKRMGYPLT